MKAGCVSLSLEERGIRHHSLKVEREGDCEMRAITPTAGNNEQRSQVEEPGECVCKP